MHTSYKAITFSYTIYSAGCTYCLLSLHRRCHQNAQSTPGQSEVQQDENCMCTDTCLVLCHTTLPELLRLFCPPLRHAENIIVALD